MQSNIIIDKPNDKHRQEWLDSAVSELIIDANLHTITDHRTINHLLGWKTPKGAAGKQSKDDRTCWAVWGKNPFDRETMYFGVQVKPDKPRNNEEGKPIKYESVIGKGEARQPLFLKVPDQIWEAIATKWAVPILPEDYEKGFWQWVLNNPQIPVAITEGAKKAGALLSHGYVTISVSGVSNGQYLGELNPYLAPFFSVGRKSVLAYDSDLHSKESVRKELDRLGRLIATSGAVPYVMQWQEDLAKGIDDFISEFGADELDKIYTDAKTFEAYRREAKDNPEKVEPEEIETEDHFNQIAIATIYKEQRYICLNDVLHLWTGTHYEPSSDSQEKRRIFRFCNTYKYYDSKIRKFTHRYANDNSVNGVLKWLKASCGVDIQNINPSGLNLLNGVLTITWHGRTPNYCLKKHSPDVIYTYVSKIKYDPNADPTYCDRLLSVLEPDQQKILLKVVAASIDLASVRAKADNRSIKCLLLKGDGNNGKDALRECFTEIFGKQSVTTCGFADFRDYDQGRKFNIAKLAYSRVNWSPENTDALLLDKLDVVKRIVTGDTIDIEFKNQDSLPLDPNFALLFNVNKMPALWGAQEAIKSRYAILSFNKTIVKNADPNNPDEIEGDPRYKYDPEFRQTQVAPALLNHLLTSLSELMEIGIDYSSCDAAIQSAREDSCHLLKWIKEIGVEYGKGQIRLGDLFNNLKQWYVDNGILDIEESSTGKEKLIWLDEGDKYDPFVKAPRLMRPAIAKLFPNAKFSEKTEFGFFVVGIQSEQFIISPNFGSFGSGEKAKEDIAVVSMAEPNPEPNNFASGFDFGSGDKTIVLKEIIRAIALEYQAENSYPVESLFRAIALIDIGAISEAKYLITPDLKEFMRHSESSKKQSFAISKLFDLILAEPTEPNNFAPEPKKPDNHAVSEPTEPNTAKTNRSSEIAQQPPLKIGDRVDVFSYKKLCEKFTRINPPYGGYIITELALNQGILQATIKHSKLRASLVVDAEWLFVAEVTA
jgi:putative DNA primase/helicase